MKQNDNDRTTNSTTFVYIQNNTKITATITSPLPEALQPVTLTGCCEDMGANMFEQTCLTERACANDTLYPFTSVQQREEFQTWKPTNQEKQQHRRICQNATEQLTPRHSWCSNNNDTDNTAFPMGCSAFSMGAGSGPYDRALVFPYSFTSRGLVFCGIPKCGITQWLQFLRFTLGAKDYQSMPYFKEDARHFYLDTLAPNVRENMWNTYTKAILIRNPAERLLSAYLEKIKSTKPAGKNSPFGSNDTFAEFVDILSMTNITKYRNNTICYTGISWFTDPHWRPQAWSCGLSENMAKLDYVGTLDQAAHHTIAILEKVGLWESHGKHYRVSARGSKKGNAAMTWPPPLTNNTDAVGFQQVVTKEGHDGLTFQHSKGSKTKLDEYYTPELMRRVKELYWMDFKLWDAVKEAESEGTVRGVDIAPKLNPECT